MSQVLARYPTVGPRTFQKVYEARTAADVSSVWAALEGFRSGFLDFGRLEDVDGSLQLIV